MGHLFYNNGFCGGLGFLGSGFMGIIALVVVVYLVYKVLGKEKFVGNSPIDDLKRKYVNGEISEDEYKRKKEVLKK